MHTQRGTLGAYARTPRAGAAFLLTLVAGLVSGSPASAATPVSLTTEAHATPVSRQVFATATLTGGENPTGTVTFTLYGPGDHACARPPVFTSTNPVSVVGSLRQATSNTATLPAEGIYHFVSSYSGDAGNAPAGPTACGSSTASIGFGNGEAPVPGGASSVSFIATASRPAVVGGTMFDTAAIASSAGPTGTVTFHLYGPGAASCTGAPVLTSSVPVNGNGSYTSAPYVPVAPGTYRWVATYSGDATSPQMGSPCTDPAQQVEVAPAAPAVGPCALIAQQQALAARVTGLQAVLARANPRVASLLGCR